MPVTFRQRVNSAELEHAFRAAVKTAQHGEQIGERSRCRPREVAE